MNLIRTAAVALVLGFAVTATTTPASAFFFHHHAKAAPTATYKHPVHDFLAAIFHCKK